MIQLPRKSVTRFFVPLIDVMILLFCIFLLMPIVNPADLAAPPKDVAAEVAKVELEVAKLKQENERLRQQKSDPLSQMSLRILEIDANSGTLFTFKNGKRHDIRSVENAKELIAEQRRVAAGKEMFFLILFPRERTGYPEQQQVENYRRWFAGVPTGFDNPLSSATP